MALSGELSDLSLAELIEFFCNQRKTGRLTVTYPSGPGYFYLQAGSVVHAEVGALRGIEAVYYALTLANASFKFTSAAESAERTINQPWTSVVLEGLRRMDEGIQPADPFPANYAQVDEEASELSEEAKTAVDAGQPVADDIEGSPAEVDPILPKDEVVESEITPMPWGSEPAWLKQPWGLGAVVGALAIVLVAIGVPWAWYAHSQGAKAMNQPKASIEATSESAPVSAEDKVVDNATPNTTGEVSNSDTDSLAAKRLRDARTKEKEKERVKTQETAPATSNAMAANPAPVSTTPAPNPTSKKVTVQVSYDENGRVTQASGADPNALRIARQKRFPPGKPGSATISIPIN
jgi:Domain of unknown function (DUF4388)